MPKAETAETILVIAETILKSYKILCRNLAINFDRSLGKQLQLQLKELYNFIEIETIQDIVHIIPRFNKKNEYFINNFIF